MGILAVSQLASWLSVVLFLSCLLLLIPIVLFWYLLICCLWFLFFSWHHQHHCSDIFLYRYPGTSLRIWDATLNAGKNSDILNIHVAPPSLVLIQILYFHILPQELMWLQIGTEWAFVVSLGWVTPHQLCKLYLDLKELDLAKWMVHHFFQILNDLVC